MFRNTLKVLIISLAIFSATYIFVAFASWQGPTEDPFPEFLHEGAISQTKTGPLSVGGVLEADQGIILNNTGGTRPTCEAPKRGLIWYHRDTDELALCKKNDAGTYEWSVIY